MLKDTWPFSEEFSQMNIRSGLIEFTKFYIKISDNHKR